MQYPISGPFFSPRRGCPRNLAWAKQKKYQNYALLRLLLTRCMYCTVFYALYSFHNFLFIVFFPQCHMHYILYIVYHAFYTSHFCTLFQCNLFQAYCSIHCICKLSTAFQYMHLCLFISVYAGLSILFNVSTYVGLVLSILLYEQ